MKRRGRILMWVGIAVVGLPLLLIGILATPPMTRVVVRNALPMVNERLNGELRVAEIGGSLFGRVHLGGVTLRDAAGEVVIQAEHVALKYGLWDLLKGRVSLGPIFLDRPLVRLVKDHPGESYSLLRVFESSGDTATGQSQIDLSIRDVHMREGTVVATVWQGMGTELEPQTLDTVQLEHLNLDLPLIHYSVRPGQERLALLEIASARGRLADPGLELYELYGEAELRGDSITIALERIDLPNSRLAVRAWIVTNPDGRRFAASAAVNRLVAADIAGLIAGAAIPPDWSFSGDIRASSRVPGGRAILVTSPNLNVSAAGGTLTGDVAVVGADNDWSAAHSRLEVAGVQIAELLAAFGIRSTLRARVDGAVTADGQAGTVDLRVAGLGGYGVRSTANGYVRAHGSMDAFSFDTRLSGAMGRVSLTGAMDRRAAGPSGRLRLHGIRGEVAALDLAALDGRLPESHINGRVEGDVTFGSLPRDGHVRLHLDASTIRAVRIDTAVIIATADSGVVTVDSILLRAPGLVATGTGTFGLREDQTGDLTLSFDAPSLAAMEPLVGALTGDTLLDLAGALQLDVTAQGSLTRYELTADLEGKNLVVAGFEIAALEARATGPPDSLRITAAADLGNETDVAAAGRVAGALVAIDSLVIDRGDASWRLEAPARVALEDGVWRFDHASLRRANASAIVTVAGSLPGDLTVTAEGVPFGDLVNRPGSDSLPELSGEARLSGGAWTGSLGMQTQSGERPLLAEFATHPLRGTVRADRLDLSLVGPLVPSLRDIAGRLDGAVTVAGTRDAPRLEGRLQLAAAGATVPATGVKYENVQGTLSFAGDVLTIERMDASAGGGTAQISGQARFTRLDRPEVDVRLTTRRFPVMNRGDMLEALATGELRLVGSPARATLTGRARVDEGTVYLDEFLRPSGIDLSDPLYAQFVDTTVLAREELGPGLVASFVDSLVLDGVSVDLGDDFWMRSPDANIQLAGRVAVASGGGANGGYEFVGTVRAVRGFYRMVLAPGVTREFTVRDGTIQFFGTAAPQARLDLTVDHALATALGETLTITARISGTVEKPVLTLSSDVTPRLSETEIISYLVFGSPTVQTFLDDEHGNRNRRSVFEQSAQRLAGVLSGRIESAVQDQLGLPVDYFRIKPGEVQSGLAGTELVFGMQVRILGRPSFLRAGPRFCPREQILSLDHIGINLETRLSPQWGVTTSIEPVQGCEAVMAGTGAKPFQFGVDVFWEKR